MRGKKLLSYILRFLYILVPLVGLGLYTSFLLQPLRDSFQCLGFIPNRRAGRRRITDKLIKLSAEMHSNSQFCEGNLHISVAHDLYGCRGNKARAFVFEHSRQSTPAMWIMSVHKIVSLLISTYEANLLSHPSNERWVWDVSHLIQHNSLNYMIVWATFSPDSTAHLHMQEWQSFPFSWFTAYCQVLRYQQCITLLL